MDSGDTGPNLLLLDNATNLINEKITSRGNEEEEDAKEGTEENNVTEDPKEKTEEESNENQKKESTDIPLLNPDAIVLSAVEMSQKFAEAVGKKEEPTEDVAETEEKNLAEVPTNENQEEKPEVNLMILENSLAKIVEKVEADDEPKSQEMDVGKQFGRIIIGEDAPPEDGRLVDPEIKEKVEEIAASVLTEDDLLDVNVDHIISEVVKDVDNTFLMTAGETRTDESGAETPKKKKKKVEEEQTITYPEEELKEAFELFEKKRTLPAYLMRDAVLDYARRQTVKFMVVEDYDSASRNDALVADLIREYSKDSGGYDTEALARTLQSRIQQANERNQNKHKKYSERIAAIKQSEQSKIDKLLEQQEQEREQFEADCHRAEFLQKFSKPSIRLLNLRRVQKSLALAHKFEEAKSVKLEGDKLQRQETLEAQYRAIQHIKKAYAQLIERQEQQLDCAVLFGQRKVRTVEEESIKEKEAHNNLTKQLETKLKETKTKRCGLPPLQSSGSKMPQSKATRNQLMRYKKSSDVTLLNVKLTNLKSVMTMKPPSALRPVKI